MNVTEADDTRAGSGAAAQEPSEEISGSVLDFHVRAAEVRQKRVRQNLLEQMRDMSTSEKQVFLLGLIMNEETLGRIWNNLIDALICELDD
ncbi:MAG TPA: hypothetical protein VNH22_20050 [Blastocatellia bacterium]|jgi:hypothetical protein|nr:hypothetical protein [Blastocatellia bacterium]